MEVPQMAEIDRLANRYLELNRFSGSIFVANSESIIYNKSFGWADYANQIPFTPNTAFNIGSISNLIYEDIILSLVKEGEIDASDKVSQYLSHVDSSQTINDLLDLVHQSSYNISPEESSSFSNYTLKDLIIKITGTSNAKNISAYTKRLGLKNTFLHSDTTNNATATGYQYHNYRGQGLELEIAPSEDSGDIINTTFIKSTPSDIWKIVKSAPRNLDVHGFLENGGFSFSLTNDLQNERTIIILSNRRHPVSREMSQCIDAILDSDEYKLPLPRVPVNLASGSLHEFVGVYELNEFVNFEVTESADSLYVTLGPNTIHLIPQSSEQFFMKDMDAAMQFLRDDKGSVNAVKLLNGFIDSDEIATRIGD